jgi:hypothetical protein
MFHPNRLIFSASAPHHDLAGASGVVSRCERARPGDAQPFRSLPRVRHAAVATWQAALRARGICGDDRERVPSRDETTGHVASPDQIQRAPIESELVRALHWPHITSAFETLASPGRTTWYWQTLAGGAGEPGCVLEELLDSLR